MEDQFRMFMSAGGFLPENLSRSEYCGSLLKFRGKGSAKL